MANVSYWESAFVRAFIVAEKRNRYLDFLKGPKHRHKVFERLNHSLDYDKSRATLLDASYSSPDALTEYLLGRGVDHTNCYFIADGSSAEGRSMRLDRAVPALLENHWGALIICPPIPIAIYKPEDAGDLVLLS